MFVLGSHPCMCAAQLQDTGSPDHSFPPGSAALHLPSRALNTRGAVENPWENMRKTMGTHSLINYQLFGSKFHTWDR